MSTQDVTRATRRNIRLALLKIASERNILFFNGTLCLLNFQSLTVTNCSTRATIVFSSFTKLANALERGKLPQLLERIREIA